MRLLPLSLFVYLLCFIDRSNIVSGLSIHHGSRSLSIGECEDFEQRQGRLPRADDASDEPAVPRRAPGLYHRLLSI